MYLSIYDVDIWKDIVNSYLQGNGVKKNWKVTPRRLGVLIDGMPLYWKRRALAYINLDGKGRSVRHVQLEEVEVLLERIIKLQIAKHGKEEANRF